MLKTATRRFCSIRDNFIPPAAADKIEDFFIKKGILEWKYNNNKVGYEYNSESGIDTDNLLDFQFTHVFFKLHALEPGGTRHIVSPQIDIIKPILDTTQFLALHRVKANLEPVKPDRYKSAWHYDVAMNKRPHPTMTTAIYYVNTCDGYTEFEDGTKVECIKNRFVRFPSNIKHRGVSQLDSKVKCVINVNYFEF
tara:strand:+ start:285 stop:869 length:585 start_codon:yes stop_codon:yes gene_type:complete